MGVLSYYLRKKKKRGPRKRQWVVWPQEALRLAWLHPPTINKSWAGTFSSVREGDGGNKSFAKKEEVPIEGWETCFI